MFADCPVDLEKFAEHAWVVERPADADLLGAAAVKLLAQAGLRIDFGSYGAASKRQADVVSRTLPDGVAFLERTNGRIHGHPHAETVVSGPSRSAECSNSADPAASLALQSWRMIGHAVMGADKEAAAVFSHAMAMRVGVPREVLELDRLQVRASEQDGPRRGRTSTSLAALGRIQDSLRAGAWFSSSTPSGIAEFSRQFLDHAPHGRHDGTPQRDALFTRAGSSPQLGESFPTYDDVRRLDVLSEIRPYASAPEGPSYLSKDFNEKSRETVQGIRADLLTVVRRARELSGVDFEVVPRTGGIRSEALQKKLKASGRSQAKIGRHTIGHAVDLAPVRNGRIDFQYGEGFEEIARAMKTASAELNIPVQWGGEWKHLVDKPHFELDRRYFPSSQEENKDTPLIALK